MDESTKTKDRTEYMRQYRAKNKQLLNEKKKQSYHASKNGENSEEMFNVIDEQRNEIDQLKKENEQLKEKLRDNEKEFAEIDLYIEQINALIPILEKKFDDASQPQPQQMVQEQPSYVGVIVPDQEPEPDEPRKVYIHDFTAKRPELPRLNRKKVEEPVEEPVKEKKKKERNEDYEVEIDEDGNIVNTSDEESESE